MITLNEIETSNKIEPPISPRVVFLSKSFASSQHFDSLYDVDNFFGKNHPMHSYAYIPFRNGCSLVFITNKIAELIDYDIVAYDKTINIADLYDTGLNFITAIGDYSKLNFTEFPR